MKTSLLAVVVAAGAASACAGLRSQPDLPVVSPPEKPQATKTRLLAFGDYITEGQIAACPAAPADPPGASGPLPAPQLPSVPSAIGYPAMLQALLAERYRGQTLTVLSHAAAAEEAESRRADFARVLTAAAPDVVLLQEGVNTLNRLHAEGIPIVVSALRDMIREAHSRGMIVFVGTLLPQRQGGCRAHDYADDTDDIVQANVQLRTMVGQERALLVDLYEAFNGKTARLLGEDGLHPSLLGYQTIADAFFAAIRSHLER